MGKEFIFENTFGLFVSQHSKIKKYDNYLYINVHNRVIQVNPITKEIFKVFGTLKYSITSFDLNSKFLLIGYENGIVEIISLDLDEESTLLFKLHRKRVTDIKCYDDKFISSSTDRTVAIFDLILSTAEFINDSSSIIKTIEANNLYFCGCGDRSIKIFNNLYQRCDMLTFEEYILNFMIFGNENQFILVVLNTGKSLIYNLKTKEQVEFNSFKNPQDIIKDENNLMIFCSKKVYIYKISSNNKLVQQRVVLLKDKVKSINLMGENIVMLLKNNILLTENENHPINLFNQNDILQVEIEGNEIFVLSKEKVTIWNKIGKKLILQNKIDLLNGTCIKVVGDKMMIGTENGLMIFDRHTLVKTKEVDEIDKVVALEYLQESANIWTVASKNQNYFYQIDFSISQPKLVVNAFTPPDLITDMAFSNNLLAVSCLDSKIYIYSVGESFSDLSLKFTLYGHSLMVKKIKFSCDGSFLASVGADKLVKVWGMDFGECRKSLIGDSLNVEFGCGENFRDELLFFHENNLNFYDKFKKSKSINCFVPGVIKVKDDYLIVSRKEGLALYSVRNNNSPIEEEDECEDLQNLLKDRNFVDVKGYNKFLVYLEDGESGDLADFYNFLLETEILEVEKYLENIDDSGLIIIMKVLKVNIKKNIILNTKILMKLIGCFGDMAITHEDFKYIKGELQKEILKLRGEVGKNYAKVKLENNLTV